MKQICIGTRADEIDEIMGDLDESLLAANDVNEVLSGHNMVSMSNSMNGDDDELMNEFDEWLRSEDVDEEHDNKAIHTVSNEPIVVTTKENETNITTIVSDKTPYLVNNVAHTSEATDQQEVLA